MKSRIIKQVALQSTSLLEGGVPHCVIEEILSAEMLSREKGT
jgi:hypothetical protein